MGCIADEHSSCKSKPTMLLPTCSVKAYTKFQFLEEIHERYRSICVQKRGTAGLMSYM